MKIPSLQGNWVDFLILVFIFFYVWERWRRGFIDLMIEFTVFIGSFILALKLYPFAAQFLVSNFSFPRGLAKASGFFILGIGFEQVLTWLATVIEERIPEKWFTHQLNRFLSILPLFGNAIIIIAFFLTLALGLPIQGRIKAAIFNSKLGRPLVLQTQNIEKVLSGIFGEALSDTFNFITINPISKEEIKLNFTQKELTIDEISEREMLVLVNNQRRKWGLKELRTNTKLQELARSYAKDMFERGYFAHYNPEGESPFDRMDKTGIKYQTAGENLAFAPNVTIAHQGLMDSKGHRENILNPEFGTVGIGVVDGGIYGKMFVQEFTD